MDPFVLVKKKQTRCVYCGIMGQTTSEHVVPKGLFSNDHKVVIPCCEPCNNGKAKDDEYFRLVFSVLLQSSEHPVAQDALKKVRRSLQRPEQERFSDMIRRSANNIQVYDSTDNLVDNRPGLDVEINRVNRTLEFIARGLLFLEDGAYLPNDYSVVSTFGREEDHAALGELAKRARTALVNAAWKEIGEGQVFKYRYAFIEEAPRSIWEFEIYQGVRIIVIISKTDPPV